MQVEMMPVSQLKPHPRNPRNHPDKAIDKLVKSLHEFGWTNPVLLSADGFILAGHARLKAAQKAGIEQVPVVRLPLSGAKADAYLIADNRLQDETDWDVPALKDLLQELDTGEFDLRLTGFDMHEIEMMMTAVNQGDIVEDEAPEPPEVPVAKLGDVWLLGKHRVMCGDSTKAEDVAKLMAGSMATAVITDPPYGIGREGIRNDDAEGLPALLGGCVSVLPVENAVVMAFQSPRLFLAWVDAVRRCGHHFERILWWCEKGNAYPWRGFRLQGEAICVSSVGSPIWDETTSHPDTFGDANAHRDGHPTQKPVSLVAALLSHTKGLAFDPFLGSGTTVIAAEQLGRTCYGMEIEPRYVDVTVKRWEQFTGKKAVRE